MINKRILFWWKRYSVLSNSFALTISGWYFLFFLINNCDLHSAENEKNNFPSSSSDARQLTDLQILFSHDCLKTLLRLHVSSTWKNSDIVNLSQAGRLHLKLNNVINIQ